MSNPKTIVLLGIEATVFKSCFGQEAEWSPYVLVSLRNDCSLGELESVMDSNDICSLVIQELDLHLEKVRNFFDSGGLVTFFGIYGDMRDPEELCSAFGFPGQWRFSAYTTHEYELTASATDWLGYTGITQQYTKSNLLCVPVQDRWMVPKAPSLQAFVDEAAGLLGGKEPDEEWKEDAKEAKESYISYCETLYEQCPLAVRQNPNGGKLAYLGFVNGDGNIPKIVRAFITKQELLK